MGTAQIQYMVVVCLFHLLIPTGCIIKGDIGYNDISICEGHFCESWASCEVFSGEPLCTLHHTTSRERAVDILFVIDNSGSMGSKQQKLADSVSSLTSSVWCNQHGFDKLQTWFDENPSKPLFQWDHEYEWIYQECGFFERLKLFNTRYHIGIISTDMNDCDRSAPNRQQRGCLQTGGSVNSPVLKWDSATVHQKFTEVLTGIGTSGSAYEKGLAAARHFLTQGHSVSPIDSCSHSRDCSGDLDQFFRSQEQSSSGATLRTDLVIVFVTDEDDCSHDGQIDEHNNTVLCYTSPHLLQSIFEFTNFFQGLKPNPQQLLLAVIGGFKPGPQGLRPSGCKETESGTSSLCTLSQGNSSADCDTCTPDGRPVCVCHPAILPEDCGGNAHAATNCCQADPAGRYYQVANQTDFAQFASICAKDYRQVMLDIARHITDYSVIPIPGGIVDSRAVRLVSKINSKWQKVPYCGVSCSRDHGGWSLQDEGKYIRLWGKWALRHGREVKVIWKN